MSDWYEVAVGAALEQGDILRACPIFRVESPTDGDGTAEVVEERHDVIVLTQTCDLENDKVQDVLVAAVIAYADLVARDGATNTNLRSESFRKAAVAGNLPAQFLLPRRETAPTSEWSLVEFHQVFSLPKSLAEQTAAESGDRLRLVPPYKEHMAQAFARYIMRVGLPTTLHEFIGVRPST